jgi:kynureninase
MKNIDVGEFRPRQVNDEEDDQVQVLSNSNVQYDTNQQVQVALMTMYKINK